MPDRLVAAVAALVALGVAGCGQNTSAATSQTSPAGSAASSASAVAVNNRRVTVSMSEYAFKPRALSAKAGTLRVTAENVGRMPHEFVVIRTTRPANRLPLKGAQASEAGAVGEVAEQAPGKSASRTFTLKPGSYVYICNVPGHYAHRMRGTLTVR